MVIGIYITEKMLACLILVQSFKERTLKKMESKLIIAFFALIAINVIKAENVKEAGKEGKSKYGMNTRPILTVLHRDF